MNLRAVLVATAFVAGVAARADAQAQLQVQHLVPGGTAFVAACPLDFDGDGDLDLFAVLNNPFVGSYVLLANDGSGGFADVSAGRFPFSPMPMRVCVAFDCDGDQDLDVFTAGTNGAELLVDTGGGHYASAQTWQQQPSTSAAVGDLDGDGDLDLVVATHTLIGGTNRILVNNGAGSFTALPPISFGGFGGGVELVDFDGDLDLDVFFTGNGMLLRNDGGLVFTDVSATTLPSVFATTAVTASGAGDLECDGDVDFVVSLGGGDSVLLDVGNSYALAGSLPFRQRTFAITCVDLDGDGDRDVVRSHNIDPLSVAVNIGSGAFLDGASRLPPFPVWSGWSAAADFDSDGDVDLMTTYGVQALQLRNLQRDVEPLAAVRGQPWNVGVWNEPGYALGDGVAVLGVALVKLPAPVALPPFGELEVDLTTTVLSADTVPVAYGARWFPFAIPSAAALAGVALHAQGLVVPLAGAPRFTACRTVVIQ